MCESYFLCAFELSLQTELLYKKNPKLLNQFQYCEKELVPFIVIVGEDEKANGGVKIRDVQTRKEVSCFLYAAKDFAVFFLRGNTAMYLGFPVVSILHKKVS